ncbi:MAG TPA: flagellar basal-body MS-ring/collar protein FliF [Pyrinomonadaceae bacterium]|nr:flagellar basal-body MS-ring/collar protein FliF [Pyrinomonadaceae bacterium]
MASPLEQVKEIWAKLPMAGRISTIGAAVATIAIIGALVYYGTATEYGVLFSDLKAEDAQKIVEKLKAANVPYSLTTNGTTIMVPPNKITELRLQMAGEGMISGGHVGFDLFDKTNFGATDFAQQVNFRRAIEGELSKTLEGMDEVEGVRVHITPKKESVFTEKEEGAKASVMLRVKQGKELSADRTEAIVNLVASSVEGLDAANVAVMDTRGRLLSAPGKGKTGGSGDASAFNSQLEAKQKYEAETAARVIALLEPVVGENRVRADIAADVDFSQVEQTEERYNPQSQVIRSQQTTAESRTANVQNPTGTVGARANDPTLPVQPNQPAQNQVGNNARNSTTTNFEIDKTTRRTIGGGGRVNRMTVSVVVDYKTVEGVDVARTTEEVQQIQNLVAAAVGTDQNRGDSVVVQTMAFNKPPTEEAAAMTWLDKNKVLVANLTKYGSLVLIALLIFLFVIRPAKKALKAAATPPVIEEETKLLEAAQETPEETLEEKRLDENSAEELTEKTAEQLAEGENLPELEPGMTVADLEAMMDAEMEKDNDILNESELDAEPVDEEFLRADRIKKEVVYQTLNDTDLVVSTLRSWLRED